MSKTFEEIMLEEHPSVKAARDKLYEWMDCKDEQTKSKVWEEFMALVDEEIG